MNLGIPEAEFWTLHPSDFNHLVKRWEVNELRKEIPIANIARAIAEPKRDREKHPQPFTVQEFLIVNHQAAPEPTAEDKANAMLRQVEMLNGMFGGQDLRLGHVTQSKEAIA